MPIKKQIVVIDSPNNLLDTLDIIALRIIFDDTILPISDYNKNLGKKKIENTWN